MDCVGCDKCRLWGKMQVTGLGTALKLLFSYDGESALPLPLSGAVSKDDPSAIVLSRSEVVAFVNTLHRLSESLAAVDKFRTLWAHRSDERERVKTNGGGTSAPAKTPFKTGLRVEDDAAPRRSESSTGTKAAAMQQSAEAELQERSRVSMAPPSAEPSSNDSRTGWREPSKGVLERLVDLCREGWATCVDRTGRYLKTEL